MQGVVAADANTSGLFRVVALSSQQGYAAGSAVAIATIDSILYAQAFTGSAFGTVNRGWARIDVSEVQLYTCTISERLAFTCTTSEALAFTCTPTERLAYTCAATERLLYTLVLEEV
jgi:hypothetical protein